MARKHPVLWTIAIIIAIPLLAVGAFLGYRAFNAARVDTWIGRQIVGMVESYIVPELAFDSLNYDAPYSVTLRNVTLTAPDGTQIIRLSRLAVTLAETPSFGEPIVIRSLSVEGGEVRIIREPDGGVRGLVPFVERTPGEDKDVDEDLRLSNVLKLRRVEVADLALLYDDAGGGPPMILRGLELALDIRPDIEQGEPGWYAVNTSFGREPQAQVAVNGRVNLDTLELDIFEANVIADVRPDNIEDLPPVLQRLFERYDASGRLTIDASGRVSISDPASGRGRAKITLEDFNVAIGEYQIPIADALINASFEQKVAVLEGLALETLEGRITGRGAVPLEGEAPGQITYEFIGIDLESFLRSKPTGGQPPDLAGTLSGSGNVSIVAQRPQESLGGTGDLQIRDGRFVSLPLIRSLAGAMDLASALFNSKKGHWANISFRLDSDRVHITKSEIVTDVFAARGGGHIMYTGELDLTLNGGPLEKLQSMLGAVGDVFGKITDGLVTYRVRGRVGDPKVSVQPLGIGG